MDTLINLFFPLINSSFRPGQLDSYIEMAADRDINTAYYAYVSELGAWDIVQQPKEQPTWLSYQRREVAQFQLADNMALLAHNNLAGRDFSKLKAGKIVYIIYGAGRVEKYRIRGSEVFQAIDPDDPYGDLINEAGNLLNTYEVYLQFYTGSGLTLQTCVSKAGSPRWGRLFVVGERCE